MYFVLAFHPGRYGGGEGGGRSRIIAGCFMLCKPEIVDRLSLILLELLVHFKCIVVNTWEYLTMRQAIQLPVEGLLVRCVMNSLELVGYFKYCKLFKSHSKAFVKRFYLLLYLSYYDVTLAVLCTNKQVGFLCGSFEFY